MPKTYEAPVLEVRKDDRLSDSVERHPAYGQIGASRCSGNAQLYGSDFEHNHYMTVRIYKSELHRSLSNDRPHARDEVIEVAMSESQWASFVSSANVGHGVPCTIGRLNSRMIPGIQREVTRRTQFQQELNRRLEETKAHIRSIVALVNALPCSQKKRDEVKHLLDVALNNLGPNLQFTADQFGEYMEETTERARMEINAYAQQMLQRFADDSARALPDGVPSPIRMLEGSIAVDADIIESN